MTMSDFCEMPLHNATSEEVRQLQTTASAGTVTA